MNYTNDSYCGIQCEKCDVLNANRKNKLEKLASDRNMKIEDLICFGCKSSKCTVWCTVCEIKKCAVNKNVNHCYKDCSEYPCLTLKKHTNVPLIENV